MECSIPVCSFNRNHCLFLFYFQMKVHTTKTFYVTLLLWLTLVTLNNSKMDPCPAKCQDKTLTPCREKCMHDKKKGESYVECQQDCYKEFFECIDQCHEDIKEENKRVESKEN